jgi:hypothetical protein
VRDLPDVFQLEFEPPDLVCVVVQGVPSADHVSVLFDHIGARVGGVPHWLLAVDIRGLVSADAAARRVAAERIARLSPYSMAVHGGGFTQRAIARLFFRATELLFRQHDNRHKICVDEQESRAWLAQQAERFRALRG